MLLEKSETAKSSGKKSEIDFLRAISDFFPEDFVTIKSIRKPDEAENVEFTGRRCVGCAEEWEAAGLARTWLRRRRGMVLSCRAVEGVCVFSSQSQLCGRGTSFGARSIFLSQDGALYDWFEKRFAPCGGAGFAGWRKKLGRRGSLRLSPATTEMLDAMCVRRVD